MTMQILCIIMQVMTAVPERATSALRSPLSDLVRP